MDQNVRHFIGWMSLLEYHARLYLDGNLPEMWVDTEDSLELWLLKAPIPRLYTTSYDKRKGQQFGPAVLSF